MTKAHLHGSHIVCHRLMSVMDYKHIICCSQIPRQLRMSSQVHRKRHPSRKSMRQLEW